MIILLLSLHIQYANCPYSHDDLNKMEVRSILVSAITIYCGIYFLVGGLDENSKLALFCIILIANVYFLYYWLVKMFGVGLEMLGNKIPCIRKRCLNKVLDGYED
mmetsp:Transcript_19392/g.3162  ORF Transcript_19392/g.3162 Transcript_19392/m.3162 type:complete len:105 (+) Transcript_19392:7018-7332(+)